MSAIVRCATTIRLARCRCRSIETMIVIIIIGITAGCIACRFIAIDRRCMGMVVIVGGRGVAIAVAAG